MSELLKDILTNTRKLCCDNCLYYKMYLHDDKNGILYYECEECYGEKEIEKFELSNPDNSDYEIDEHLLVKYIQNSVIPEQVVSEYLKYLEYPAEVYKNKNIIKELVDDTNEGHRGIKEYKLLNNYLKDL